VGVERGDECVERADATPPFGPPDTLIRESAAA